MGCGLDEDSGVMVSGVQMGMPDKTLGESLYVVVHQGEQAEPRGQNERALEGFKDRDDTDSTGAFVR